MLALEFSVRFAVFRVPNVEAVGASVPETVVGPAIVAPAVPHDRVLAVSIRLPFVPPASALPVRLTLDLKSAALAGGDRDGIITSEGLGGWS